MTDYTELKRAAEAASQGRWNQDGFDVQNDDINDYRVARCNRLADAKFIAAANPAAVLALITENERLERLALDSVNAEHAANIDLESICAERDQLHAESAGLKTGYEAYERVNAELKAGVERLDKLLIDASGTLRKASSWICREVEAGTKSATYWAIRLRETADQIDTALGQGGQS